MANLFLVTTFLLLVCAHADPNDENDNNPFRGFPFGQFPFSNIQFPQVRFPQFKPIIPKFPPINIPSPQDIINKYPKPGESFNGIVVHSSNGYTTDEKGNVIKTDGTTVLTNENGVLKEYKVGKNPPEIKTNIIPPFKHPKITIEEKTRPEINLSKLPKIVLPKLPDINIPGIVQISGIQLPTIDFSQLPDIPASKSVSSGHYNVKYIKPAANQNFMGSSLMSFALSRNVNGISDYVGVSKDIVKNNGQVDERALVIERNVI